MSEFVQQSFIGGMNLKEDDTRLQPNQYRAAFNCRNRNDVLEGVYNSAIDDQAPSGLLQELVTFGEYQLLFANGNAYYKHYTGIEWTRINGFAMNPTAPRYWTEAIPLTITNYKRYLTDVSSINARILLSNVSASFAGNLPGLLVQDNINQPRFIFLDALGQIQCRTTQNFEQWSVVWDVTGPPATTYSIDGDQREYVPIGNCMKFVDGILYIVSQDKSAIYRSVSGRPLDFVVNVDIDGQKGGDATTTSYSVGVGNISAIRATNDGSLFVAAGNANFAVSKNMTQNAPVLWGEYTFIRKFLFNATCLDDRCALDSIGDTRFIDVTGVRSFNAVEQAQNEGRNSVFTSQIQAAFTSIRQEVGYAAAILYDNYELYAVNSVFGPAIAVYDSLNQVWVAFDIGMTGGKRIKQFAKIELSVQRLYAITEDNKVYELYASSEFATSFVRTSAVTSSALVNENNERSAKGEVKPTSARVVLNNVIADSNISVLPFVNNRKSKDGTFQKYITYNEPVSPYTGVLDLPDIDTMLANCFWTFPNAEQGWKVFFIIEWTGGTLTQYSATFTDVTPMNPLNSQVSVK